MASGNLLNGVRDFNCKDKTRLEVKVMLSSKVNLPNPKRGWGQEASIIRVFLELFLDMQGPCWGGDTCHGRVGGGGGHD